MENIPENDTPVSQTSIPAPHKRVRRTSATRRRAENMLRSIDKFKEGQMNSLDFSLFLAFSASGARKYLSDLEKAGVLKSIEPESGLFIYKLSDDQTAIDSFIADMKDILSTEPVIQKATPIHSETVGRYDARNIHIAHDDHAFRVSMKPNYGEGRRDPLVSALFGPPRRSRPDTEIE